MINQEDWPIEYADQLVVGDLTSNLAVCCFWSSRDHLKSMLDPKQYSVIGNLYSRAGINPMLRNILANPKIRYLLLTGKSLTDSEEALLDFFNRGVDNDWRIIGNGGQIDRDLPLEAIEDVRKNVELIDLRDAQRFAPEFQQVADEINILPPFAEPRTFPKTPPSAQTFPSEFAGFVVRKRTILEAWYEILWAVMTFGQISPTDYGLEQKEVLALLSVIENPATSFDKVPSWAPFKDEDVKAYLKRFFEGEKSGEVAYNYGYRLQSHWGEDQIKLLAAELQKSGHSRRALASLWDPIEDSKSENPPCIITIQAAVRDGGLHLIAYIRSNDMFRAYPLNAAALAELQSRLVKQLDSVRVGSLSVLSFSAHIYSDCWDACQQAIAEAGKLRMRFEQDPRGNINLRLDSGQFVADHFSPAGDLIQTFRADDARDLGNLIAPFVGRVDHGIYLGKEINRLLSASVTGEHYEQDKV
jgi:thymidylate synthase